MKTLSDKEAITDLEIRLAAAERLADAEEAYHAAHGDGGPWTGAMRKRDDLAAELNGLRLRIRGEALSKALAELTQIDRELALCEERKKIADHSVRLAGENESVKRYLAAGSICRARGWGHSWVLFQPWYESGKARYAGLPETGVFFLDSPLAQAAGVRFNLTSDREAVMRYNEARNAANKAVMAWSAAADRRARLLQEHPELNATG